MSDPVPLDFSGLPRPWLAQLVQHVAAGPGGIASAAALSQTCSSFHALSESSAVSYRNIHVRHPISSPDHPFWEWLAKRKGRFAGIMLRVEIRHSLTEGAWGGSKVNWEGPIQQLAVLPDVKLTVAATSISK